MILAGRLEGVQDQRAVGEGNSRGGDDIAGASGSVGMAGVGRGEMRLFVSLSCHY
jgi:hypothetical protein